MTSERGARTTLNVLLVLSLILIGAIAFPFGTGLLLAAVLAGALHPAYVAVARRLRGRETIAALLLTLGVLLAVVVPLASIAAVVVREIVDGVRFVQETLQSEGVAGLVEALPGPLQIPAQRLLAWLPRGLEGIQGRVGEQTGKAAAAVGDVVAATSQVVIQTAMMLIALFFFLVDGRRLVGWLNEVVPLGPGLVTELLGDFRRVSVTVLGSQLATSAIQSVVAGVGYLIARAPSPLFFTLVTFFMSFVPAIGGAGVALVLSGLLYLTGHVVAAIFLAVYAVAVVGTVDNIVKPLLIRGRELHGAVVFFSLLGGITVFGPIGLVAGPLAVAFFLALVRMRQREAGAQR